VPAACLSLGGVRIRNGDHAADDLARLMDNTAIAGDAVEQYRRRADHQPARAVCASIAHVARPNIRTPGNSAYDAVLRRLSRLEGMRYAACEEGSALIRETERLGTEFANLADFGRGFQGYCSKLHGTHARIALILHLLDDPDEPSIPPAAIERAAWLTSTQQCRVRRPSGHAISQAGY
jgi:hypothetical protein